MEMPKAILLLLLAHFPRFGTIAANVPLFSSESPPIIKTHHNKRTIAVISSGQPAYPKNNHTFAVIITNVKEAEAPHHPEII